MRPGGSRLLCLLCAQLALLGCDSRTVSLDAATAEEMGADAVQPRCLGGTTSSDLAGVSIEFTATQWSYSLATARAGIKVGYRIVVEQDVSGVRPRESGACFAHEPDGFVPFERMDGNGQSYCICDVGLCAPNPANKLITVKQGVYPHEFSWDGHNWTGPSDFGNPKGPYFPAGDYRLTVKVNGTYSSTNDITQLIPFSVRAGCQLTLTP